MILNRLALLSLLVSVSAFAVDPAAQETSSRYATQVGQWSYQYLPLRSELHNQIVNRRLQAGEADTRPRLIFTAGPFGAGKSFVTTALEKLDILDVSRFIWIDPDSIKEELPEYKDLKVSDPDNAATLVHKESGHIQEQLLETALKSKKNIIVDGSLRGKDWWESEFRRIRKSYPDYSISIISVTAPENILLQRVEARGRVTGRFVPTELVLESSTAVRESVGHLASFADSVVEIENGITPTIKSITVAGKVMSTHFDLSSELGAAAAKAVTVTPMKEVELAEVAGHFKKVVVITGYGGLGYEDYSLLKSYVDNIVETFDPDTLFIFSHPQGIGRALDWISSKTTHFVVGTDAAVMSLLAKPEINARTEMVSLRGEQTDVELLKSGLSQKVPVLLVRDPSLNPEMESVALQLTRNPRFDADPTRAFEEHGYQQGPLRLVRNLEVPQIQRVYEERTRTLRQLYRRIETVSDQELVKTVLSTYPEMILLTEGTVASPEAQAEKKSIIQTRTLPLELSWLHSDSGILYPAQVITEAAVNGQSVSSELYNKAYPEFDRTVTSLLLFKRLLAGDYDRFTQGQPENVKLTRESFLEISKLVRRVAFNTSTRDALFSFLIFNNVGKSESLISYLKKTSGLQETNHQRVMFQLLKTYPFISPTYQRLDEFQRSLVLGSFEREFNLAQLVQGEAPPRYLLEHALRSKEGRDFYLATSLLKVAAARGHDTVQGSLVMTQPTYNGLKTGMNVVQDLTDSEASIVEKYNDFLRQRSLVLMPESNRELSLTRMCLMFRCQNPADGQELVQAFEHFSSEDKQVLKREFSATGFGNDSALLLYYGPATLDNLRKVVSRADFFKRGLHLLVSVLRAARLEEARLGAKGVTLIRLDPLARQIRDNNGLPDAHQVEIYNDVSYGLSARLKESVCAHVLKPTIVP